MTARAATIAVPRCALCRCELADGERAAGVCADCSTRPEAKRLRLGGPTVSGAARGFTPADKGLIRKLHGYMPLAQLLSILNERLAADLGPDAAPYTLAQLQVEIPDPISPTSGEDWTGVRQLLAQARRTGLLARLTPQVLDDFAVVYMLTPAQHMHLQDVVLHAKEDL